MAFIKVLHATARHVVPFHSLAEACDTHCQIAWKVGFSAALIAQVLLSFFIVLRLINRESHNPRRFETLLRIASTGAAGVGLATALLHLFRESEILLDHVEYGHSHAGQHSPTVFNAIIGVYFVALLCDRALRLPEATHTSDADDVKNTPMDDIEASMYTINERFGTTFIPTERPSEYLSEKSVDEPRTRNIVSQGVRTAEFRGALHRVFRASARVTVEAIALGGSTHIVCVSAVFLAIATRIWAVAATLSAEFNAVPLTASAQLVLVTLFTLAAPLGVGIGAGLGSINLTVRAVISTILSGIFLYFSAFSTPAEQFVQNRDRVVSKFCAMLVGALLVVIITSSLAVMKVY